MEAQENQEQRIAQLESNLERAGILGKQLLEQLALKTSECDELSERCSGCEVQIDSLKQKLHSAERDLDLANAREQNALREIESLQGICSKYETLQHDKKTLEEKNRLLESEKQRRSQTIADLEEHLQEVRTELSLAKSQIEELKLLEKSREQTDKPPLTREDAEDDDQEDPETLVVKVESLQTELENLRAILKQNIEEMELAVKRNLQSENKLDEAIEEKNSIARELGFHLNTVNEKNRKIAELSEEIDALKAAETDPNRRGNSIFAEVEDRRIEVELELLETRTRWKYAEESKRRLKNQLAHCYTSLQLLASHNSKAEQNYVKTLEREVIRLRTELSLTATRVATAKVEDEVYTDKDLQDNPLTGMLLSERRQNAASKKKIEALIHQGDKRTEEILRLGSELRTSQSELEQVGKQRTILQMKLKEKLITEGTPNENFPLETQTEVIKEVVEDVVQETERTKATEQKLLTAEEITETTGDDPGERAPNNAMPQTSQNEAGDQNFRCPTGTNPEKSTIKTVNFGEDEKLERPKQQQQAPKARGRQVTVLKRTKVEKSDCKAQ